MFKNHKRKEVWLSDSDIEKLKKMAKDRNQSLKSFIEYIILKHLKTIT